MSDIQIAKRSLGRELRALDGYVGISIDQNGIRLYANAETAPVVKILHERWGVTYEGFHVSVVLTDGFKAQSSRA